MHTTLTPASKEVVSTSITLYINIANKVSLQASGTFDKNWNDTEKINMFPAQG